MKLNNSIAFVLNCSDIVLMDDLMLLVLVDSFLKLLFLVVILSLFFPLLSG